MAIAKLPDLQYPRLTAIMRGTYVIVRRCRKALILVISAARLRGLESDLHLTGQDFPTLLSILYVGYILMQIPS